MSFNRPKHVGGALTDTTNAFSNRSRLSKSKHSHLLVSGSRKSTPTCTVSLANASCSTSDSVLQEVNVVPFPTASSISFPVSESDCDSGSLALLRDDPIVTHPHPIRRRTSQAELRRKRSHARLAQSTLQHPNILINSSPKPRKRSGSGSRKGPKRVTADLQFQAVVHRSVAWRLAGRLQLELEAGSEAYQVGEEVMDVDMDVQDKLLVKRIHSYLMKQGVKLDSSVEIAPPLSSSRSSPIPGTACPSDKILSMPQLVAALILRHRDRSLRRRSTLSVQSPEAKAICGTSNPSVSNPSPLAMVLERSS